MTYSELIELAQELGLKVTDKYYFEADLNAFILNDKIKISDKLLMIEERKCALIEEIAHFLINNGNITDLRNIENSRQEYRAHKLAVNMMIKLTDIVDAVLYLGDDANEYNVAEHLGITVKFLNEAIEIYRKTYGTKVDLGSCTVSFIPTFVVTEKHK